MAYKKFHHSKMHDLLAEKLAHIPGLVESGRLMPAEMATKCGRCKFTIYRWMGGEKLPLTAAKQLIDLSMDPATGKPSLTLEDLIPYL